MNGWIKAVIGLSVVVAVALTFAWRYYVDAPTRTQAAYKALVAEVAPTYKYYKIADHEIKPQTIGALFGGDVDDTLDTLIKPKSPSEIIAESKLNGLGVAYSADNILGDYKSVLTPFEPRFDALKTEHLAPCERDDFFSQWAALRQWTAWADVEQAKLDDSDNRVAIYESEAVKYTGRPLSFAEIKAIGEAQFAEVSTELMALDARVKAKFGMSLDEFALRDENFSSTPEDLASRVAPMLRHVESTFAELGDFNFAPVPAANVTAQEGLGPNLAIASYRRREDTMVIYSGEGLYNHIYDMMLVVHEIMPGHHQQLAMERKRSCGQGPISAITPFLEGWATYAEILADERGFFDAPADRLGWLDYKLVRAMRIKLDVARVEDDISEEQGWKLWHEAMPTRLHDDFAREWARVSNSRHHLAYITGSQAILQARETIKARLGDDFDEAEFHAALLNGHYRTMNFLTERTEAQIYARRLKNLEQGNNIETSL